MYLFDSDEAKIINDYKYFSPVFICDWMGNTGNDKCRTGSIKKSQWYSLVLGLFTTWANCDILYCNIGIHNKEVKNAGLKAVGIIKGGYFYG